MTQDQDLEQIKLKIQDHLISSGNYDKINKQLKLSLYESGWYDKLSRMAVSELQNNEDINFNQLMSFLKPKAESMVPDSVRQETLNKIRDYLDDVIQ